MSLDSHSRHSLVLQKNMPMTMQDLKKKAPNKPVLKNVAKSGMNVLQRLVTSFESGRSINLINILTHELQKVPLSVAEANGELRCGDGTSFIEFSSKSVQSYH